MWNIVQYPARVLTTKAAEVERLDATTLEQIQGLLETLSKTENGAGLAAPQIGISKRFFGLKHPKTKQITVYVNPRITDTYGLQKQYFYLESDKGEKEDFLEGCLSIPDYFGTVKRYSKIQADFFVVDWEAKSMIKKRAVFEQYAAIVFQHELDHLDGILFTQRVLEQGNNLYEERGDELIKKEI